MSVRGRKRRASIPLFTCGGEIATGVAWAAESTPFHHRVGKLSSSIGPRWREKTASSRLDPGHGAFGTDCHRVPFARYDLSAAVVLGEVVEIADSREFDLVFGPGGQASNQAFSYPSSMASGTAATAWAAGAKGDGRP